MMYKLHTHIRSPNYEARHPDTTVNFLIMHYTGCGLEASLKVLTDSNAEHRVSAHYLVDETGEVYALVDEAFRSWHAGKSAWQGFEDINSRSVGIEIVNPGQGANYRAFPSVQMESLACLSKGIIERWRISPCHVLGHSDIAPGRKVDPGPLFDWKWLAEHDIGVYPDIEKNQQPQKWAGQNQERESEKNPFDKSKHIEQSPGWPLSQLPAIREIQHLLFQYGYTVPLSGILDLQTRSVIEAFQMHFWPESVLKGGTLTAYDSNKQAIKLERIHGGKESNERQEKVPLGFKGEGNLDEKTAAGLIQRLKFLTDLLDRQSCLHF